MKKKHILHYTLFIFTLFAKLEITAQCAMCRAVLDSEENIRLNYYKRLQKLKNKGNDNQITY